MLDFLGDVGGLFSILVGIGQLVVNFKDYIFGSHLESFLIDKIFKSKFLED